MMTQDLIEQNSRLEDILLRDGRVDAESIMGFLDIVHTESAGTRDLCKFQVAIRLFRMWKTYLLHHYGYIYAKDTCRTDFICETEQDLPAATYLYNPRPARYPPDRVAAAFGLGEFVPVTGDLPSNDVLRRGLRQSLVEEADG